MQTFGPMFLAHFVVICFIVAFVCSLIRERRKDYVIKEGFNFFFMMLLGISILSIIVFGLEMVFIK